MVLFIGDVWGRNVDTLPLQRALVDLKAGQGEDGEDEDSEDAYIPEATDGLHERADDRLQA